MSIILLVEDEVKQAELLKKTLLKDSNNIRIINAYTAKEAFDHATKNKIDLFILDFELPDKTGLKLAEEIRSLPAYESTWMIFITAFPQYIHDVLDKVHCNAYIIKPYDNEKVRRLVNDLLKKKIVLVEEKVETYFDIKQKGTTYHIPTNQILFIEVNLRECFIHTYASIHEAKRLSIKSALLQLSDQKFVQCHKSIIVNIDYINIIEKIGNNWEISLLNYPQKILVGEKYRKNLFKLYSSKVSNKGVYHA